MPAPDPAPAPAPAPGTSPAPAPATAPDTSPGPELSPARRARLLVLMFGLAAVVLAADQIAKALALDNLPGHPPVRLLDGLITLRLTFNAGVAFGVGTSYTVFITLLVCGVIVCIIRTARRLRSLAWTIALGLVLGGATGNFADRIFRAPGPLRGRVVDWINLPHFPWTFNIADSSITCAAVLMAILAIRGLRIDGTHAPRPSATPRPEQADSPSATPAP